MPMFSKTVTYIFGGRDAVNEMWPVSPDGRKHELDVEDPFNTPFIRALTGITGFPEPMINTWDQIITTPGSALQHPVYTDLTLTFTNTVDTPIDAVFYKWLAYYVDEKTPIAIYRFNLDVHGYIVSYALVRGMLQCPSTPDVLFNNQLLLLCRPGLFEYNNTAILDDFKATAERVYPELHKWVGVVTTLTAEHAADYVQAPYITVYPTGLKIETVNYPKKG